MNIQKKSRFHTKTNPGLKYTDFWRTFFHPTVLYAFFCPWCWSNDFSCGAILHVTLRFFVLVACMMLLVHSNHLGEWREICILEQICITIIIYYLACHLYIYSARSMWVRDYANVVLGLFCGQCFVTSTFLRPYCGFHITKW